MRSVQLKRTRAKTLLKHSYAKPPDLACYNFKERLWLGICHLAQFLQINKL